MKKKTFGLVTASLFLASFLLSVSVSSSGKVSLLNKAAATEPINNYQAYTLICPNGLFITLCGTGGNGCIPAGVCSGLMP